MALSKNAFVKYLQSEIPHMRRYARSITQSPDAGDDLMQTALERALRRWSQFKTSTGLRKWVFTIIRNAHLDDLRKMERSGCHVPIEEWYQETHLSPTQEQYLVLNDVAKGIERLRPEDRRVLQLSVFGGLSHGEIARDTGVAVGTVKSRLSRARQALAA